MLLCAFVKCASCNLVTIYTALQVNACARQRQPFERQLHKTRRFASSVVAEATVQNQHATVLLCMLLLPQIAGEEGHWQSKHAFERTREGASSDAMMCHSAAAQC